MRCLGEGPSAHRRIREIVASAAFFAFFGHSGMHMDHWTTGPLSMQELHIIDLPNNPEPATRLSSLPSPIPRAPPAHPRL